MKILELRLQNLNSLYGEWHIDFTNPEYVSNGIFALTGPTGAGKSTLLDAICLALYGATPRLGKITKSGNEIMSRQTGECFAEVVFECQSGSYRCKWTQHRAKKSPEGKLQDQEHEISDAKTGTLIETKKSLVLGVIEEKTGMDFDRFTRSILLAQGGFDTFLNAETEQKSKILEQITGTEIYSDISRRVHERNREERETLNLLQAETLGIVIIEPNQEEQMLQNLQISQSQETELNINSTATKKAIDWINNINILKMDIYNLLEEESKLQLAVEAFKPQQEKLESSKKAASLDGEYATLISIRKQQTEDLAAVKEEESKLPGIEFSVKQQLEYLQTAEQSAIKAKEELKSEAPLIQKVRSMDQILEGRIKSISEATDSCNKEMANIQASQQVQLQEKAMRSVAEKSLEKIEQYLNEHTQDEWLISGLVGIEEQLNNLASKHKQTIQKEADLKSAVRSLAEASKQLETISNQCASGRIKLSDAQKSLQQGKKILTDLLGDKSLREYRTDKEVLQKEKEYLARIAALEVQRANLQEGKPCPLCGSVDHPFSSGNVPIPDEIDQSIELLNKLIKQAEDQEALIKKLEESESTIRDSLHSSEKLETISVNDRNTAEKTVTELTVTIKELQCELELIKEILVGKLQPLGIIEITESIVSNIISSLNSRLVLWQEKISKKREYEKQIAIIDAAIDRVNTVIEIQTTTLLEKQQGLQQLQNEHTSLKNQREMLYSNKNPSDEEIRLSNAISDMEDKVKKATSMTLDLQQKLLSINIHIKSLNKNIEQRNPKLQTEEERFLSSLKIVNFEDEKEFLAAKISNEEHEMLSIQGNKLGYDVIQLKAKREDRETRLTTEIDKNISDKTLEELDLKFKEYQESLNGLRDLIAELKHKLNENTQAKDRIKDKQVFIDKQKKECSHWEKLQNLIGSADGKKFRNFAQGLTFELLVSHANHYLQKMTDRYLLARNELEPLQLNVVDNYQAGEVRSTKNLSGGECFIVSLTLALGLSKMSSRKVRVDSLFLDEGFGALDEDALETALDVLSGLHHQGKLICVISHVSAMKERISCQLKVSPSHSGKSILLGPGCRQISNVSQ